MLGARGGRMKFDTLLHKLANHEGWSILYVKEDDTYKVQVATPGDRRQDVYVTFRKDEAGSWVAAIWSVVAEVADFNMSDPLELLRFNWRNLYGALAAKGDQVVLVQNQLTDEANWNEVGRAIHNVAL